VTNLYIKYLFYYSGIYEEKTNTLNIYYLFYYLSMYTVKKYFHDL